MLRPCHRAIVTREVLHALANPHGTVGDFNLPADPKLRERQDRLHGEHAGGDIEIVWNDGCLAVHGQPCRGLFGRRSAEDIEAQVVRFLDERLAS